MVREGDIRGAGPSEGRYEVGWLLRSRWDMTYVACVERERTGWDMMIRRKKFPLLYPRVRRIGISGVLSYLGFSMGNGRYDLQATELLHSATAQVESIIGDGSAARYLRFQRDNRTHFGGLISS